MKIIISNRAQLNLEQIFLYIANDSLKYAIKTINDIYSLIYKLDSYPYIGKYIPEFNNKQYKKLIYKSYRIIYEISNSKIFIHTSKNFYKHIY